MSWNAKSCDSIAIVWYKTKEIIWNTITHFVNKGKMNNNFYHLYKNICESFFVLLFCLIRINDLVSMNHKLTEEMSATISYNSFTLFCIAFNKIRLPMVVPFVRCIVRYDFTLPKKKKISNFGYMKNLPPVKSPKANFLQRKISQKWQNKIEKNQLTGLVGKTKLRKFKQEKCPKKMTKEIFEKCPRQCLPINGKMKSFWEIFLSFSRCWGLLRHFFTIFFFNFLGQG